VSVGCFPPPLHVVDALGIGLEGFGERSDQSSDGLLALIEVPSALSAQRLQSLSRQLQESLVVAFERLPRQALEGLAQAGAGLVKLVLLFLQLLEYSRSVFPPLQNQRLGERVARWFSVHPSDGRRLSA